ncbi:MAG: hypothetical protein K8S24_08060, partial [Candidatus Aegiribacteria sp.]|nr:hypothetical protein [Candidatus Aegiribacteria sp.]
LGVFHTVWSVSGIIREPQTSGMLVSGIIREPQASGMLVSGRNRRFTGTNGLLYEQVMGLWKIHYPIAFRCDETTSFPVFDYD